MLDRLAEFFVFGFAPLVIGTLMMPLQSFAQEKSVTGEILYRERIALPPNAVVKVWLSDVSLADAPAKIIGEQTFKEPGQVPIKFEIRFDPAVIQPKHTYSLQARITVDDTIWFINDVRYRLDPLKAEPQSMVLRMVKRSMETEPPPIFRTTWLAEDIEGGGVIDDAQSTLKFDPGGKISGRGACNSYFGKATIEGSTIKLGDIGSTFMACAPAIMDQEKKLFAALSKASSYRIDADGKMFLVDAEGRDVIRFASAE
ncbi:YbaY family lipoprotein [Mesorhizobium sp. DCY119]|uniref:YbaY family lipoprotein n=1 Tax=Mesorhizobium sp. DCY119 TaxID=2108445 RepID=UPI000E6C46B4|nr:YbaY family lipoprotein [Mesorhizobium sp. DCY119]RJG45741.1 META domain-containing protein [Mesorhizobium sp. DCY119]